MNPHRHKYHDLYWEMAYDCATQSVSEVLKVGAAVVTDTGLISPGWNGMPAGMDNCCEDHTKLKIDELTNKERPSTKPHVIHAERNALDKMTNQGIATRNSVVFVTTAPCFECAKALHNLGLKALVYDHFYKDISGIQFLNQFMPVMQRYEAVKYFHLFGS